MCNGSKEKDAPYDLCQAMLTPFEKSVLLDLEDAKMIKYEETSDTGVQMSTTLYSADEIKSMKTYNKLFSLDKLIVDNQEERFADLVKKLNWQIGIH